MMPRPVRILWCNLTGRHQAQPFTVPDRGEFTICYQCGTITPVEFPTGKQFRRHREPVWPYLYWSLVAFVGILGVIYVGTNWSWVLERLGIR